MSGRDAASLVDVWERGIDLPPILRALLLLDASEAGRLDSPSTADAAALTIGERDRQLLRMRSAMFGTGIEAVTRCPACGLEIELALSADELAGGTAPSDARSMISGDGWTATVRAVTSADILAVSERPLPEAARALAERCVVKSQWATGEPLVVEGIGDAELTAIGEELARLDPGASIDLALACPDCASEWVAAFDVVGFFWKEFDTWARRTLADVHALAISYGWAERDILALHPRRRQHYLDLVQA